jgi:hypothetical protein
MLFRQAIDEFVLTYKLKKTIHLTPLMVMHMI